MVKAEMGNNTQRQSGFTLLEVMVALVILAVGMSALVRAAGGNANSAAYLKNKTFAQWVAANKINEIRLEHQWPETGSKSGRVFYAGIEWAWKQQTLNTEDSEVRRIEVSVQQEVERGALDLAVLFQEPGQGAPGNEVIERLRRVWVSVPGLVINPDEPLPLILSNGPCIFRNSVLSALDAIGRSWRIVLSTPSLAGIRAGVRAGLGVCVRSERWLEEDLKVIDQGLPPLPDVELAILSGPNTGERVVERLRTALRGALSQVS